MDKKLAVLVLAALAVGLAGPALAQGGSPAPPPELAARVSSIVGRFPGGTAAATAALAAELVALGPAGLAGTLALVEPPGGADDAKARFAVNGLAVHVTRPGAERERLLFVKALLAAAAASPDKDRASFFISQVELAGRAEAVKPLALFLSDGSLAGPAARALQAIGGPEAARALLAALSAKKAPAGDVAAVVEALGALRSREAVKKLIPLAASNDEGLRRAARAALANIGDPAATGVLSRVLVSSSSGERARAPQDLLLFARRLVESGRAAEGLAAARALLASHRGPAESQVAAGALSLLASAIGPEALPDLLQAACGPDARLRGAALEAAAGIAWDGAALGRWIGRAKDSGPETRAGIIDMVGRSGDPAALAFIRESLADPDKVVRLAAIRSSPPDDASLLLRLLDTADDEEAAALRAGLLRFEAGDVVPAAARRIDTTPHPGKAVLIDVLGEKGARGEIERVFRLAADPEPATRAAALGALAKLAGEFELPSLVAMLEKAVDAEDIVRLQDAVIAASRGADPGRRGTALVGLMKDASPARKAAVLRVLSRVGGERALRAVVEETAAADLQVQAAAVYALSQWPDFGAAEGLLRVAATTASRRYRLLALDGYVRLVGQSGTPAAGKLALYKDLLGQAFDDADKKAVVRGLGAVRDPGSLRLLAGLLDNPALGETAAAALLDLASEQAPHERWLSGPEAHSALRRVEALQADPAEKARVAALVADRLRQGGFVPLFDGRSLAGWKGLVADPPARARMAPAELAAAQAGADERMRAHWRVADGVLVFDGEGDSLCTAADYGDFELLVDWKIEKGGDSGLYLRGSPQVQIWDAEANPAGSGGLYNNRKGPSAPLEKADRPVGEWNTFRIVMIGERVTVFLNDRLVVDDVVLENYWERDKPIYPSGPIELQAHDSPLYFRNIFIREIPRGEAAPSARTDPAPAASFPGIRTAEEHSPPGLASEGRLDP